MTEPRCERTELLVSACDHCRTPPPAPARRPAPPVDDELDGLDFGPSRPHTIATFESECACDCGGGVVPGDQIELSDDGWVLEGHG